MDGETGASGAPDDAVAIGRIGRPHGVRGEMRVLPESGDPRRLLGVSRVWIAAQGGEPGGRPHAVTSVRLHGGAALVQLSGVTDRDAAAALTHAELWARAAELPELGPDEFSVGDVVGAELVDVDRTVGRVVAVVEVGDADYFEVKVVEALGGRTVLVPAVKAWMVEMDLRGRRMVMRLPEGILET